MIASSMLGNGTNIATLPYYAHGPRLATEHGPAGIETLRPGDRLLTLGDTLRPIRFIGRRVVNCHAHPNPQSVWPVRILAGAFARRVPERDLYLSPNHAVFADGVLVPVRCLVNGSTVCQVPAAAVTYLHVELESHDVILAEELPAESYLDLGDRHAFSNQDGPVQLHPEFGTSDAMLLRDAVSCARFAVTGKRIERVMAMLAARANDIAGLAAPPSGGRTRRR